MPNLPTFYIDCCVEDPEEKLEQSYEKGYVRVHNTVDEESAIMTAELIEACFERGNTGIREADCQYRIEHLAETMDVLYKTLSNYKEHSEKERYVRSLKSSLSRKSVFAAFKRSYVRKHILDYPAVKEFLV